MSENQFFDSWEWQINNPHTQTLSAGSFFEKKRTVDDARGKLHVQNSEKKP
jgi:hypothetical protein